MNGVGNPGNSLQKRNRNFAFDPGHGVKIMLTRLLSAQLFHITI